METLSDRKVRFLVINFVQSCASGWGEGLNNENERVRLTRRNCIHVRVPSRESDAPLSCRNQQYELLHFLGHIERLISIFLLPIFSEGWAKIKMNSSVTVEGVFCTVSSVSIVLHHRVKTHKNV